MKTVQYRRKREGRTNYAKRLQLLVSRQHRIVIRKSLKHIVVQVVDYQENGDKVLLSTHSRELKAYGISHVSNNIAISYLTGLLCGKKAISKGIKEGIIDFGLQRAHPKGKLMAVVKGLVDSGMQIPHGKESLPDESKLKGEHVVEFSKIADKKLFSGYSNAKMDISKFSEIINKVQSKILEK